MQLVDKLYYLKRKKKDAIPHKLEDINLSEIYTLTHDKEKFLQADLFE